MTLIKVQSIDLTPETEALFDELMLPKSELFREVALEVIPLIHERIHVKGLAADGSEIGVYSDAYMKVRTGDYSNSSRVSRGVNKGKTKDSGTTTRGANKGGARNKYNRSSDPKIILSLTRQMENDYAVIPGDVGWGIGFNNSANFDKASWNDDRYGKVIYDLTDDELKAVVELTETLITERFK